MSRPKKTKHVGKLEPFWETGTEGVVWAIIEDGKKEYDALVVICERDHLKVFGEDGSVVFDGVIDPDYEAGWEPFPLNPGYGQPVALGYRVHWTQRGWAPDDWARLFVCEQGRKPLCAELIKSPRRKPLRR